MTEIRLPLVDGRTFDDALTPVEQALADAVTELPVTGLQVVSSSWSRWRPYASSSRT